MEDTKTFFVTEPMVFTVTVPEVKIKTTEGEIIIKYQPQNEETK